MGANVMSNNNENKKLEFKLKQTFKEAGQLLSSNSLEVVSGNGKEFESNIEFSTQKRDLSEGLYCVTLTTTLTSKVPGEEKPFMQVSSVYSGIFEINNASEEELEDVIRKHCNSILYPFCRADIKYTIIDTVYPKIDLPTINFFDMPAKEKEKSKV
jgi:preprotein translocase subunit SecB